MDNSRERQLARFSAEMKNFHLPRDRRKRAAHAYYRIKRQLRDRQLTRLRYEYICADAVGDDAARESIGSRIEAVMYKKYKHRI